MQSLWTISVRRILSVRPWKQNWTSWEVFIAQIGIRMRDCLILTSLSWMRHRRPFQQRKLRDISSAETSWMSLAWRLRICRTIFARTCQSRIITPILWPIIGRSSTVTTNSRKCSTCQKSRKTWSIKFSLKSAWIWRFRHGGWRLWITWPSGMSSARNDKSSSKSTPRSKDVRKRYSKWSSSASRAGLSVTLIKQSARHATTESGRWKWRLSASRCAFGDWESWKSRAESRTNIKNTYAQLSQWWPWCMDPNLRNLSTKKTKNKSFLSKLWKKIWFRSCLAVMLSKTRKIYSRNCCVHRSSIEASRLKYMPCTSTSTTSGTASRIATSASRERARCYTFCGRKRWKNSVIRH